MSDEESLADFPGLTPSQRRAVAVAEQIYGEPDAAEMAFLHSIFAATFLPYREPKGPLWERASGRASLLIRAGQLYDARDGKWLSFGIPYGSRPRLILLHLCSQAVRRQSPVVDVGDSMTSFMRDTLKIAPTGGKSGTIAGFKEQLNRLSACDIRMGFGEDVAGGTRSHTTKSSGFVESVDLWFPADPEQKVLWPSTVRLSNEFYQGVLEHALPLDERAVRGLQHSARALDIYTWLVHRLPKVKAEGGEFVSWQALHAQFGGGGDSLKSFRRAFITALRLAQDCYPNARLQDVEGGLRLYRSRPAIARKG